MAKLLRIVGVPAFAAFSALFMVLPHGGGDATVRFSGAGPQWRIVPAEVRIDPGQRVAFANDTTETHTATCIGCGWDTGDVQPGQTVFITFRTAQSHAFACRYHRGEVGRLTVGDVAPAPEPTPAGTAEPSPIVVPTA
jgi:plastocyanin